MYRKKISYQTRRIILIIFAILTILSLFTSYIVTPKEKITEEETITLCNYMHLGNFYYFAKLTNNTVYDNATIIYPNQNTVFKKITDSLNFTFNYNLISNCARITEGTYKLDAEIQTESWDKKYELIPEIKFGPEGINTEFGINISYYEEIMNQIEEEVDVIDIEPYLVLTNQIEIEIQSSNKNRTENFNPSISIPLKDNVLNITGNLSQNQKGYFNQTIETPIPDEETYSQRNQFIYLGIIFLIPLIIILFFTQNNYEKIDKNEKTIRKTLKKYNEWIIEVDQLPKKSKDIEIIKTKTLDDLIKTSEELGKPVIHYTSKTDNIHNFYVIEEKTRYEHTITQTKNKENKEKIKKHEISDDIKNIIIELHKNQVPVEGIISQINDKDEKEHKTITEKMIKKIIKEYNEK
jgi:hypothetical protein